MPDFEAQKHLELEQRIVQHVKRLMGDDRLRLDTKQGSRPVAGYRQHLDESDELPELRKLLADAGTPDRTLEKQYPQGVTLDVALLRRKWFVFAETSGRLYVKVVSPLKSLTRGETARPVTATEALKMVSEAGAGNVPATIVLASTSGFSPEARDLAERRAGRTVILLEPNGAGGWRVHGPAETRGLVELFDPELEDDKRKRVRDYVTARQLDLGGSGLASDKVAAATLLPPQMVDAELKSLAKETPGWAARRLDGRLVLFRTGAALQPAGSSQEPAMIDRIKALFGRGGETEKKIAYLSERRAALGQQRDRLYEELASFEAKETQLRNEFKDSAGVLGKRRITSQMLQIRKDADRRQQLLTVLNQQISVVGVHLHNMELARTGTAQGMPTSDEIAEDAAKAEQVLAELQANSELAEGVGGLTGGISDEEAALMAELEAEAFGEPAAPSPTQRVSTPRTSEQIPPIPTPGERTRGSLPPSRNTPEAG